MEAPSNEWSLLGARVTQEPRDAPPLTVEIQDGRIGRLAAPGASPRARAPQRINLQGHLILPGLINAHDHLEFALFRRLGRGPYQNSQVWANAVYRPDESPVKEHLRIPKRERLLWGGLKNLLSGVTTVCHHNPYQEELFEPAFPVRVVKRFGWAHSLALSPEIAERFRETSSDAPFIVHLGEATDAAGREEIFQLDRIGALDSRTVLVHAVALDAKGLSLVASRRASIVWCPSSNLFTLGTTFDAHSTKAKVRVALGTDSSLTADGNLFDELRVAESWGGLPKEDLFAMVTTTAAEILRLDDSEGELRTGGVADLVVIRDSGRSPARALLGLRTKDLELVVVGGMVKLLSIRLAEQIGACWGRQLHSIRVEGEGDFLVDAPVGSLLAGARRALEPLGDPVQLGGAAISP